MAFTVSTAVVDGRAQHEYWRDAICATFVPLELELPEREPSHFHGELTAQDLGVVEVATIRADPHAVYRSPKTISASRDDAMFVMMPRAGRLHIAQDGRETMLRRGDFATYDSARPCRIGTADPLSLLVVKISRAAFADRCLPCPRPDSTATAVRGDRGIGAVVAPVLRSLPETVATLPPDIVPRIGGTVLELVSAALSLVGTPDRPAGLPHAAHRQRAQRYILDHLGDPDLTPSGVAAALGISVRYLYLLFEEEAAAPARWITAQRLARAAQLLRDTGGDPGPDSGRHAGSAGLNITEIAFRVGFQDASVFSRAFKACYGRSPREYRRAHARA